MMVLGRTWSCTCPYDDEGGPNLVYGRDPSCPVHGKDRPMTIRLGSEATSFTSTTTVICPDLLSIRDIGAADGWRGRVVRAFFRVLKVVTGT